MFRFGFLFRILLALLVVGVLVSGGMALFRAGWAQGYQTAAITASASASSGDKGTAPQLPYSPYYPPMRFYPGYGYPFFPPFGIFLGIGFFLFIFFVIGSMFRFAAYRHWAGAHGYGPGDRGPWGPGGSGVEGRGPWGRMGPCGPYGHHGWKEQPTEQPEKNAPTGEPPVQV